MEPYSGHHVAQRGTIRHREMGESFAEEFDELADDPVLPQRFSDGQHEISGCGTFQQSAPQAHAEHPRNEHRARLAQHCRLRFDASDTPADHAKPIHHGRV